MSIKIILLIILILAIALPGCKEDPVLEWSVTEDRSTVSGTLTDCECSVADIEMLVTNENTGEDFISTFTIHAGIRFQRPVGVVSDWVSVDLKVVSTR